MTFAGNLLVRNTRLLDKYPGAAAAYSLRQLSSSATNVVRVRRSSDDAEADFTAAEVSDGTLESWVGVGNDGLVSIWYDQSGNGYNATQVATSNQPKIVSAGFLVTENGKPAIDFSSTNLLTATVTGLQDFTGFTVFGIITPSLASAPDASTQIVFGMASGGGNAQGKGFSVGGATSTLSGEYLCVFFAGGVTGRLGSNTYRHSANEQILHTVSGGSTGTILRKNGEPILLNLVYNINTSTNTSPDAGNFSADTFHLNSVNGINVGAVQKEQEKILYPLVLSSSRSSIETNINNYYSIF